MAGILSLPVKKVVILAALGGVATYLALLGKPDVYQSEALLLPNSGIRSGLLGALGVSSLLASDLAGEEAYYTDLLDSRWMMETLAGETFDFPYRTWKFGAPKHHSGTLVGFLEPGRTADDDQVVQRLRAWISSRSNLKSGTISVAVTAPSPELAFKLNREVVLQLERGLKERVVSQSQAKAEYTATRVDRARREEADARARFVAFSRDHVNYATSPDAGVRTLGETLYADLQVKREVVSAMSQALVQAEVAAHSTLPVVSVLDDGYLPTRKSGPPRLAIALTAALGIGMGLWSLQQAALSRERRKHGQPG